MLMLRLLTAAILTLSAASATVQAQATPKPDQEKSTAQQQIPSNESSTRIFQPPPMPPMSTEFISLAFDPNGEFMNSLQSILSPYSRVASFGNTLVIQGTDEDHDVARKLIAAISDNEPVEEPPATGDVQLTFYFVSASVDPTSASSTPIGGPLPEGLKSVASALAENGFYDTRLLAPLVVQARDNSRPLPSRRSGSGSQSRRGTHSFEISGMARGVNSISVQGATTRQPGQNSTELTIKTRVSGARAGLPLNQINMGIFELETTLTVPFGDYVVLAAAPCNTDNFEALVLVVKAEPID
ncbi:MAG: hypothetical protein ABIG44_02300 [Planctomycetota bacterium]